MHEIGHARRRHGRDTTNVHQHQLRTRGAQPAHLVVDTRRHTPQASNDDIGDVRCADINSADGLANINGGRVIRVNRAIRVEQKDYRDM